MPEARTLLLDSASLYYRSYYALPDSLVSPEGIPINAVRGFLDTVASMLTARGSTTVIACWDEDWRPQWRVDLVPSYKTHRVADTAASGSADEEEIPDTLAPQVGMLREILPLLGVPVVGVPEAEADDVIADLSAELPGHIDVASGDRDLVQLVNERVTLLYTGGSSASRGGKPWLVMEPEAARERFGVPPERYADLAVLRGDPSDGLPGAKGVGDKTAVALVSAFGGLAEILEAAAQPDAPRPLTPAVRSSLDTSRAELLAAERVVRLVPMRGRSAITEADRIDVHAGLALAESWGVLAPARRLVDALHALVE